MKQEDGKGFIKLILGITIISIVIVLAVMYIKNSLEKEKVKDMQADLLLIQAKIEIAAGNYNMNKEAYPLKGVQLSALPEDININEFKEKNVITQEEYEKYYLLNSGNLTELGLDELVNKYPGYFIVNYEIYEVVYTKGYENANGLWCYKISDLNKMPEVKNSTEQINQENQQEALPENTDGNAATEQSTENKASE